MVVKVILLLDDGNCGRSSVCYSVQVLRRLATSARRSGLHVQLVHHFCYFTKCITVQCQETPEQWQVKTGNAWDDEGDFFCF